LGIKIDACPGRLNQVNIFINRQGTFFGQCSEICGINHSFMPIVIESYDLQEHRIIIANVEKQSEPKIEPPVIESTYSKPSKVVVYDPSDNVSDGSSWA